MIRTIYLNDDTDTMIRIAAAEIGVTPEDYIAATFCNHGGALVTLKPTARRVAGMIRPTLANLEERIARFLEIAPASKDAIRRRIGNRPAVEIEAALRNMIAAGRIRCDLSEAGGRPARVYTLIIKTEAAR